MISVLQKRHRYSINILLIFFFICLILGGSVLLGLINDISETSVLENVQRIYTDNNLIQSIINTALLFAVSTILQILIAIYFTIYFLSIPNQAKPFLVLPYATGVVAPAFAFKVAFTSSTGPFHFYFIDNSLGPIAIVALIDTWQWLGILLLACVLKTEKIPPSHFEQARLEGMSRLYRWWLITRPELQSLLFFYFIIRLLDWVFKVDAIKAIFGQGGPGHSVETLGIYIIKTYYYDSVNKGYASLLSIFQLLILGIFVLLAINRSRLAKITHPR